MHIRCERCSTVYELDERILPAGGAPVQCSRCQHLFQAHPPAVPGKTLRRFSPFQDASGPTPAPSVARPPAAPAAPGPTAPRQPAAAPGQPTDAAGQPPSGAASARSGAAGRDRTSDSATIPVRQIRSRRMWRWLAPLFLLVAAGAVGGVLWYGSRQISAEALARRQDGLRLLAGDDCHALERAAEVLADAARLDPKLFQARADRALALILLAADERNRASALEGSARPPDAERFRLVGEALADLEVLGRSHRDDPAVARALAMHYVLDGDAEQASRVVRSARAARLSDPWLDLAEAAEDVVGANSEVARQRAVARLAPLAAAHPDLLRARMLLARAQADLGRTDAAVAALDGVLEANGAHDGARAMKERLLELPSAEPMGSSVPQGDPPAGRPGLLPRKPEGAGR